MSIYFELAKALVNVWSKEVAENRQRCEEIGIDYCCPRCKTPNEFGEFCDYQCGRMPEEKEQSL